MSFEVVSCQLLHFGPHRTMPKRMLGAVRVRIRETIMGNPIDYALDLKVRADCGQAPHEKVRTALLTHAAHQLNRLKSRRASHLPIAAE